LLFKHVDFSGKPYKEIYPEQFLWNMKKK
jgi:hypothetical protein